MSQTKFVYYHESPRFITWLVQDSLMG